MIRIANLLKHGTKHQYHSVCNEHVWTSSKIRKTFTEYFASEDHLFVPSSSVIPKKTDGSYFVNAGMNQFKPLFLGTVDNRSQMATYKRVANYQKCIRVGGKHNDLDDVGKDDYHHTFFEMLGNWSFNDYGKVEACKMAWDLLTNVYNIPKERLFVTYFKGDEALGLLPDTACREIWRSIGVPENRILPFGSKENFWSMGETGPCGPCTEIHYCHNKDLDVGRSLVNAGNDSVVELWNLVFMEYDRHSDGALRPLPQKHIDTGMGLERLTAVLNNTSSNYDTDLFRGLLAHIHRSGNMPRCGHSLTDPIDQAYRIVADHSRMFTVTIGDGLLPGNKDSEGKLRQIMYKCLYQAKEVLNAPNGFLKTLVPVVIDSLGDAYPNLSINQKMIMDVTQETEQRYLDSVVAGRKVMKKAMSVYGNVEKLSGDQLLRIQEGKFGKVVSFDIISLLAPEFHVTLDVEDFENKLKASQGNGSANMKSMDLTLDQYDLKYLSDNGVKLTIDEADLIASYCPKTKSYEFPELTRKVVALKVGNEFVSEASQGTENCGVILEGTNFYARGGGQKSDSGRLKDFGKVTEVNNFGGYYLHNVCELEGDIKVGDMATTEIDGDLRTNCMANHTATHIIHYALNEVLGQVKQQGSSVNSDNLTFDFTCLKSQVTMEDLKEVIEIINEFIKGDYKVKRFVAPLHEVVKDKRIFRLENEVYPNDVTVVNISKNPLDRSDPMFYYEHLNEFTSLELCCGTHVGCARDIQGIAILNLEGMNQGTKRLVAVTRRFAESAANNYKRLMEELDKIEKNDKVGHIVSRLYGIEKNLSKFILSKIDREIILGRIDEMRQRTNGAKNKIIFSSIVDAIKNDISNKRVHSTAPVVVQIPYQKSREAIAGLLTYNPEQPLFLLSTYHNSSHVGVVFVPEAFSHFQSKEWADHVCEKLGGQHSLPKGKFKKYENIAVFSIPLVENRIKEAEDIVRLAEEFVTEKEPKAGHGVWS